MTLKPWIAAAGALFILTGIAQAQEDGSEVILPLEAQTCNLPVAPAKVPEEASYDQLVTAKENVSKFQADMLDYRDCLDGSKGNEALTDGNNMALVNAHNYSVEMEERVAEEFNSAVRAYKARKAEAEQ